MVRQNFYTVYTNTSTNVETSTHNIISNIFNKEYTQHILVVKQDIKSLSQFIIRNFAAATRCCGGYNLNKL